MDPILVLGGTGKTGKRVVSRLEEQGVSARVGARQTGFDWLDESTWDRALAGVKAVFVVPLDGTTLTRAFVDKAVANGVERVVLLSGRGVDNPEYGSDTNATGLTHVEGEKAVRELEIPWTILRPGWFAQNFSEGFFAPAVQAGELRLPAGGGGVTFVDAQDIADVAVAALTEDKHAGEIYELSGPQAVTMAEAAEAISAAGGRQVRYVPLTVDEFVAESIRDGWPPQDAADFAEVVSAIERGLEDHVSDGVDRALGRAPRDFKTFANTTTW
ncbi:NAD(P)H-binding protein [Kibdelosporangium philippinense]|uniref:NAD(P)H-binding protein n=1 Tax=Kibdelosporangium philippinense TaxID=211113 RepID=A0ABS8Z518_9PSEU|nr:NAD(P)H-binding protein [Kibdelosporangium philippinense]MCE7002955.1 NAD(P)H-binding protein [Kibdelosporangium philippinense]